MVFFMYLTGSSKRGEISLRYSFTEEASKYEDLLESSEEVVDRVANPSAYPRENLANFSSPVYMYVYEHIASYVGNRPLVCPYMIFLLICICRYYSNQHINVYTKRHFCVSKCPYRGYAMTLHQPWLLRGHFGWQKCSVAGWHILFLHR